jgi:hypothetical protein
VIAGYKEDLFAKKVLNGRIPILPFFNEAVVFFIQPVPGTLPPGLFI